MTEHRTLDKVQFESLLTARTRTKPESAIPQPCLGTSGQSHHAALTRHGTNDSYFTK